jgi:Prealbumin-like fold domain
MMVIIATAVLASHPEVSLPGSNFEIDTDANLKVDDPAPSIDWASVAETRRADAPSGSGDNSFGQGTKEDTAVPSVVSGSIPPNKSDLLNFGVSLETTGTGARFLNLFWHRVQEPSGTTNMDFEFNQSSTTSANGVTPVRTAGDLLVQYDLSQGGVNPVLFVSRWVTSGATSQCEASNSLPCWGTKTNLSAAGDAAGSINTSAIPAAEADGLGAISARTFGEAQLDFDALTGGSSNCASFGSAYLKSRSSDSFTAALKDFIAPASLNLNNCGSVTIRKETNPEENPNATNFGFSKTFTTQPSSLNTFTLQDDGVKTFTGVVQGNGYVVDEDVIPAGWDLTGIDCNVSGHPSVGVTPTINVAAGTVTFNIDSASDVLDCTYTNRARGTIIVEKITSDGTGAFDFTSSTLSPASWTLTTTAAGAGGKDSKTFADLAPGTYDAAETVPAGWNLTSSTCSDGSTPASIGLSAGETVTCTFTNARERGAIEIVKVRKHAAGGSGDQPHSGVTFVVTGGSLAAPGSSVVTLADGKVCVDNLVVSSLVGNYTVTETVPAGYVAKSVNPQTNLAVVEGSCAGVKTTVNFSNMPLTDITVSVNSQVDGGTGSTIDCSPAVAGIDKTVPAATPDNGDGSYTKANLEPGTYTCTIVVDP